MEGCMSSSAVAVCLFNKGVGLEASRCTWNPVLTKQVVGRTRKLSAVVVEVW